MTVFEHVFEKFLVRPSVIEQCFFLPQPPNSGHEIPHTTKLWKLFCGGVRQVLQPPLAWLKKYILKFKYLY